MELVGKREKMIKLKSRMEEEETSRNAHLRTAKEALRLRREKVAIRQANESSLSDMESPSSAEKVSKMLADNGDSIEFFMKIQRLMEKKSAEVEEEVSAIRLESDNVERRIAGYEHYMEKDESMAMQNENYVPVPQQ